MPHGLRPQPQTFRSAKAAIGHYSAHRERRAGLAVLRDPGGGPPDEWSAAYVGEALRRAGVDPGSGLYRALAWWATHADEARTPDDLAAELAAELSASEAGLSPREVEGLRRAGWAKFWQALGAFEAELAAAGLLEAKVEVGIADFTDPTRQRLRLPESGYRALVDAAGVRTLGPPLIGADFTDPTILRGPRSAALVALRTHEHLAAADAREVVAKPRRLVEAAERETLVAATVAAVESGDVEAAEVDGILVDELGVSRSRAQAIRREAGISLGRGGSRTGAGRKIKRNE